MFIAIIVAVFSISSVLTSPTGSQCDFSQEAIESDLLSCAAREPRFMLEIIQHLKDPSSMMNSEFICNNQKNLVELMVCMEKKLVSCLPNGQFILDVLPSQQKWLKGLNFICDHRADLIENKCMQSTVQDFVQCYFGKLRETNLLAGSEFTRENLQYAICGIVKMEESCIQSFHGTCSQEIVDLTFTALEKFFPMDKCSSVQSQPFDNILVHGAPLKFLPAGEVKYNVIPN